MYNDPSILFFPFCCGTVFLFLLLAFLILWRYIQYRETLTLADKGLLKQVNGKIEPHGEGRATLRWGVVIASIGLALTVGLWPLGVNTDYPLWIGPWMLGGFLPLFFGLGLILLYLINRQPKDDKPGEPPAKM